MKYFFTILIFSISAFCLIFPSDMIAASKNGILLWANIIVPSLLPFLILSDLIQKTAIPSLLAKLLNPIMKPIFKLPGISSLALILGITGGYPIGAKVTSDLRNQSSLTKISARRLISFSNNAGPLFISGAIGLGLYKSSQIGFLLILVHYISAVCVGIIFRFYNFKTYEDKISSPPKFNFQLVDFSKFPQMLTDSIKKSILAVTTIGGFILLFSILSAILERTELLSLLSGFLLPKVSKDIANSLLIGVLEVTNGVNAIANSNISLFLKLILTSSLIGFGGFSVHMQTLGILSDSDIGFSTYFSGKILQGIFSAIITFLMLKYTSFSTSVPLPTFSGIEHNSIGFYKLFSVITGLFVFSVVFKIIQTIVYSKFLKKRL